MYLYENGSSHYQDYIDNIITPLGKLGAVNYFAQLKQSDPIWKVWQTVTTKDSSLARLFSANSCNNNSLGLSPDDFKNASESLTRLSNKGTNLIATNLKKVVNSFVTLVVLTFAVIFYTIFHSLFKYDKMNYEENNASPIAVNFIILVYVLYCIEEVIRINIILQ